VRTLREIMDRKEIKVIDAGDDGFSAIFFKPLPIIQLRMIVSNGGGWDHVSVSHPRRCPKWFEMDTIKRLCFRPDEVVMQLHPAESDHINHYTTCLHLWRPQGDLIPLPPKEMV